MPPPGVVVEFDEVERRAVRALAEVGLVPPLRHRGAPATADRLPRGRPPDGLTAGRTDCVLLHVSAARLTTRWPAASDDC